MSSIFDMDPPDGKKPTKDVKRSKHRESLTPAELLSGKRKLSEMVESAFMALQDAMVAADHPTAIKAAQIILDRAGFGPKSTVDVNTTHTDLSALSREELAERASKIAGILRSQGKEVPVTIKTPDTIQ